MADGGIFIALGANLPTERHGAPRQALEAALNLLRNFNVEVVARSPWYATAPVPKSDQPDYVNGIVRVFTKMGAERLLATLHAVEAELGRTRTVRNEARVADLDLIDYGGMIVDGPALVLPHPRAHLRGFVLIPLRDVAPDWRHPVTGAAIDDLIEELPDANDVRRL